MPSYLRIQWLKFQLKLDKDLLHTAVANRDDRLLRELLSALGELGIDINQRGRSLRVSPVDYAYISQRYSNMLLLLEAGAKPYIPDKEGDTILSTIFLNQNLGLFKALLWYDSSYQHIPIPMLGTTTTSRLKLWEFANQQNKRWPGSIQQTIEQTLQLIQEVNEAEGVAEKKLAIAKKQGTLPDERQACYLEAVPQYHKIARIFEQESITERHALKGSVFDNMMAEALIPHYQRKALKYYQLALKEGYEPLDKSNLTEELRTDYAEALQHTAELLAGFNDIPEAKTQYAKAAEQYTLLAQTSTQPALKAKYNQFAQVLYKGLINQYANTLTPQQLQEYHHALQQLTLSPILVASNPQTMKLEVNEGSYTQHSGTPSFTLSHVRKRVTAKVQQNEEELTKNHYRASTEEESKILPLTPSF